MYAVHVQVCLGCDQVRGVHASDLGLNEAFDLLNVPALGEVPPALPALDPVNTQEVREALLGEPDRPADEADAIWKITTGRNRFLPEESTDSRPVASRRRFPVLLPVSDRPHAHAEPLRDLPLK